MSATPCEFCERADYDLWQAQAQLAASQATVLAWREALTPLLLRTPYCPRGYALVGDCSPDCPMAALHRMLATPAGPDAALRAIVEDGVRSGILIAVTHEVGAGERADRAAAWIATHHLDAIVSRLIGERAEGSET